MVLGNLTDLCLTGHGFIQKSFQENKEFGSRLDRRLTQVGTELKGFFSDWGMLPRLPASSCADPEFFLSVGGGGGLSPTDTNKVIFIFNIYI